MAAGDLLICSMSCLTVKGFRQLMQGAEDVVLLSAECNTDVSVAVGGLASP